LKIVIYFLGTICPPRYNFASLRCTKSLTSTGSAHRGWLGYSGADRVPGTKWRVYRGQQVAHLDTILLHFVAQNHLLRQAQHIAVGLGIHPLTECLERSGGCIEGSKSPTSIQSAAADHSVGMGTHQLTECS
jgi:hypothetical protein